jgi:hypothetical protein
VTISLRKFNFVAGVAHLVQAVLVLVLSNDFSIPVTATFLDGPPGSGSGTTTTLFNLGVGYGVALFLLMSAVAHLVLILPGVFEWYEAELALKRNYARWVEYSLSSSLMIVLIALLPGITDISALLAIFGVNAAMILFGLLMEKYEEPGNPSWTSYWFGVIAGSVPWIAIAIYLWTPGSDAEPPAFVYGIFISLFVFFNTFAINMVLQYKQISKWRNYIFGERFYIVLSLTAKTLLAWQVFGGTLAV